MADMSHFLRQESYLQDLSRLHVCTVAACAVL